MIALCTGADASSGMDASAWVSVVAAAIAVVAVIVAIWQARAAKAQADATKVQAHAAVRQTDLQERIHRDSAQPYVWADFRLDPTQGALMRLVIRNEGPTVAEDVRVVFDPPLQGAGLVGDVNYVQQVLSRGFQSMPPGREMRWNFAVGHVLFSDDSNVPLRYTVTITGRGPFGELPQVRYELDLEDFHQVAAPRLGSLEDVAKAIRDLER